MSPESILTSQNVVVIGAGPAGLVTARELQREGHKVVVLERGAELGGIWVYTPEVESDQLGHDPDRNIVHSSIYSSLRVNVPRECLGFREFPFVAKEGADRDSRRFPSHKEVLKYLQDFASTFKLEQLVRYNTTVVDVRQAVDGKWKVRSMTKDQTQQQVKKDEIFDAVVVCNGHYTEPRTADDIPGIDRWPGRQLHSHNYRMPKQYADLVVVVIGSATSAIEISRDIASNAKAVHIASRSMSKNNWRMVEGYNNLWMHPTIASANEDGSILFEDGEVVIADVILHCTGYKYYFPFLQSNNIVTVDDNRVDPLYKHIFQPFLAPSLSFVGIPWKVLPFPMFELQSRWIACVLSGRVALPSVETMIEDIHSFYNQLEHKRVSKRYTHYMNDKQFEYNDWIASQIGCPLSEDWRKQMYSFAISSWEIRPKTYQDEWDDEHLIPEAHRDLAKYLKVDSITDIN